MNYPDDDTTNARRPSMDAPPMDEPAAVMPPPLDQARSEQVTWSSPTQPNPPAQTPPAQTPPALFPPTESTAYASASSGPTAGGPVAPTPVIASGPNGTAPHPTGFAADQSATTVAESKPPRSRRGPGWPGVIAVGAGAAVLSSLLTAGLVSGANRNDAARPTATQNSTSTSAPTAPAASNVISPDWAEVAKTVEPSVVAVKISTNGREVGEGSGVILDTAGHIITNAHVVSEGSAAEISVVLADGRIFPVTILGTDPSADLAVLKFDSTPADLSPATFADSGTVTVGQPVMAVGNPLGLAETATTGIVSAVDRPVTAGGTTNALGQRTGEQVVTNAIQTDAAINPGNSGGALVDAQGQVIGITSSIASLNSGGGQAGSIGLGFAIPSSTASRIASQIISSGKAAHAYLGVDVGDTQVKVDNAERQAALIRSVGDGTPAAQAGLKPEDAVIAVDGKTVESADSLVARVRELEPDNKVRLTVVRDGAAQEVEVTLAQRPQSN